MACQTQLTRPTRDRRLDDHPLPLATFGYDEIIARSNDERFDGRLANLSGPGLAFRPHSGWLGHVEIGAG